jgi:tetratricopeptide (TPR) repeat protein
LKLPLIVQKYFLFLFLWLFLCLNPVQAQDTDSPSLTRGLKFYNESKFDQALDEFSKLIEKDPSNIEAHYFKGLTFNKAEKADKAVATFKKVLELDPKYNGARLQLGIAYYKLNSNKEAIQEFNNVLEKNPQNATANLFMGFTYQQMEQYEDSLIYFQTAMSLDPSLSQISFFQIGVAYAEMNEKEDAKLAMELVLEEDSSTETAKQAKLLLDQLGGKTSSGEKSWWITAGMSWQYDDNVTVEEQDILVDEQDMALNYELGFGTRLAINKNASFELGYDFSQSLWDKLPEFDYQSHYFSTSAAYAFGDWDADLSYGFNYSFLDRGDFIAMHNITPRLGFVPKPNLYTSASYSFSRKNFLSDNARDGVNHAWSLTQFIFFMENKAYALISYGLDLEDTEDPEFDYIGHSALAAVRLPGPFAINANLSYNYNYQNYKSVTASIGEQRFDAKHTVQFILSRYVLDALEMKIDFTRIMSNSNLASVDFVQDVILVGFSYKM